MKQAEWHQEAYANFRQMALDKYDFTTCQRPDGSYYGTGGQCRKGTETTKADEKPKGKKGKGGGGSGVIGSVELNSGDDVYNRLMYNDDKVSRGAAKLIKQQNKGNISSDDMMDGIRDLLKKAGHKVKIDDDELLDEVIYPMEDRI